MATLRVRSRKDGRAYTSVLFRVNGKQSSLSFDDHVKAIREVAWCEPVRPCRGL